MAAKLIGGAAADPPKEAFQMLPPMSWACRRPDLWDELTMRLKQFGHVSARLRGNNGESEATKVDNQARRKP
jgi:hypothetical protein